jgi:hypothetical protein
MYVYFFDSDFDVEAGGLQGRMVSYLEAVQYAKSIRLLASWNVQIIVRVWFSGVDWRFSLLYGVLLTGR